MELESRHQCLIYDGSPSKQLPTLANLTQSKLNAGYRCLYLNSPPMVAGLRGLLASMNINVADEVAKTRLILSSESNTTADGGFDVDLMLHRLEDAVDQALSAGYKGLWATGDMTWEFGSEKNFSKLMDYEYKLEQLFFKRQELYGICQYHKDTLPGDVPRQALLMHKTICINETISRINPYYFSSALPGNQMAANSDLDKAVTELCQLHRTEIPRPDFQSGTKVQAAPPQKKRSPKRP